MADCRSRILPTSTKPLRSLVSIVSTHNLYLHKPESTAADVDWAQHGITGRGVLLDLVRFYTVSGASLPYDPWTSHAIPLQDLLKCAEQQGVTFKQGDILLLRMGFTQRYYGALTEERDGLAGKPETLRVFHWRRKLV